jgi:hypothetical protein
MFSVAYNRASTQASSKDDGTEVGILLGNTVGLGVFSCPIASGEAVGKFVGWEVGRDDGWPVGTEEGTPRGWYEGIV